MRFLTSLAFAAMIVSTAQAQQQPTAAQRQACEGDYSKFCSGVIPGGGRIIACLKKNADKLSAACNAALKDAGK